jgi:hypothetical protein
MTSSPSTTTLFSPTISAPSLSRSGSSFIDMLSPVDTDTGADQLPVLAYEPCKALAPSITKDEVLAATPKRPSLLARLGRAFGVCPQRLRAPAAEFFGTMILLLVGTGVNCQVVLSQDSSISASPQGVCTANMLSWLVLATDDLLCRITSQAVWAGQAPWPSESPSLVVSQVDTLTPL